MLLAFMMQMEYHCFRNAAQKLGVNAFAGEGKAKALKMLINSKDYQDNFMELGRGGMYQ